MNGARTTKASTLVSIVPYSPSYLIVNLKAWSTKVLIERDDSNTRCATISPKSKHFNFTCELTFSNKKQIKRKSKCSTHELLKWEQSNEKSRIKMNLKQRSINGSSKRVRRGEKRHQDQGDRPNGADQPLMVAAASNWWWRLVVEGGGHSRRPWWSAAPWRFGHGRFINPKS